MLASGFLKKYPPADSNMQPKMRTIELKWGGNGDSMASREKTDGGTHVFKKK